MGPEQPPELLFLITDTLYVQDDAQERIQASPTCMTLLYFMKHMQVALNALSIC